MTTRAKSVATHPGVRCASRGTMFGTTGLSLDVDASKGLSSLQVWVLDQQLVSAVTSARRDQIWDRSVVVAKGMVNVW